MSFLTLTKLASKLPTTLCKHKLRTLSTSINPCNKVSSNNPRCNSPCNNILVLNCGSSSVKFQIIDPTTQVVSLKGIAERLGTKSTRLKHQSGSFKYEQIFSKGLDHEQALAIISELSNKHKFSAIGHRVVHGGDLYKKSVKISSEVKEKIRDLSELAPLHNPVNLLGIEQMEKVYPGMAQVAVFDTAYHQTMPEKAYRYAIPEMWLDKFKIRRYGFHGISHSHVVQEASKIKGSRKLAVVSAHLGNGCSVTASLNGQCMDTSMGFSPLEGLVMGQRSGELDPTVVPYICKKLNCSPDHVLDVLNKESGLFGLTRGTADFRDIEESYSKGCLIAEMAVEMLTYRLAKYIASYLVTLGRLDVLVFTGGIGENSALKREKVIGLLSPLGLTCDGSRNASHGRTSSHVISEEGCDPIVLVIPANEELVIARETLDEII